MAKKTKARNQGQNQDQPVDSEIRRAAERIGVVPADAEAQAKEAERQRLDAFFGTAIVRCLDHVSELQATLRRDRLRSTLTTIALLEAVEQTLDDMSEILWSARWESGMCGGDERLRLVETEVGS